MRDKILCTDNPIPYQHVVYRATKAGKFTVQFFYLFWLLFIGNFDAVKHWLEVQFLDIDEMDYYGNSLLYYACLCDHPIIIYLLARYFLNSIYNNYI